MSRYSYYVDDDGPCNIPNGTTILNWDKGNFYAVEVPVSVTCLTLMRTMCDTLPSIHEGLINLTVFYSDLKRIQKLPKSLEKFSCMGTEITELSCNWPKGLQFLCLKNINTVNLVNLPDTLRILELWNINNLHVQSLPGNLQFLEVQNVNRYKFNGNIPNSLLEFNGHPAKVKRKLDDGTQVVEETPIFAKFKSTL